MLFGPVLAVLAVGLPERTSIDSQISASRLIRPDGGVGLDPGSGWCLLVPGLWIAGTHLSRRCQSWIRDLGSRVACRPEARPTAIYKSGLIRALNSAAEMITV